MSSTKIATCCYCGTRAALNFAQRGRHELACSGCGAPLHSLKALRVDATDPPAPSRERRRKGVHRTRPIPHGPRDWTPEPPPPKPKKSRKRRKSPLRRLLGEVIDVLEDILD